VKEINSRGSRVFKLCLRSLLHVIYNAVDTGFATERRLVRDLHNTRGVRGIVSRVRK